MILVTGASRGIGRFLFQRLRDHGDIVGTFHSTEVPSKDGLLQLDVTKEAQVERFVAEHKERLRHLSVIHCAGVSEAGMVQNLTLERWQRCVDVNLTSAFLLAKYLIPIMTRDRYGRFVLFSSIVPQVGVPGVTAYSAAKAGLWGFVKSLSRETARFGITCNGLNLGYFGIGMIGELPESERQALVEQIPMGKLGDPVEILRAVEFLISSGYMTGSFIDLNGGLF